MRQKALKALDGDAAAAEEILESLVVDGFVDDARYAGAFAREKAVLDGWGPVKIRYMLRGKGIEASDIDEALASIDAGAASEKLDKLLAAKAKSLQGDPQARLKLIKYALSRGYNYEDIKV
jgi:regulatory protein